MDVRGKLVELIGSTEYGNGSLVGNNFQKGFIEKIATHLIANGVTVKEWISVDARLPPYNHDVLVYRPNMGMKILVDCYAGYYGEDDDEWHEGWVRYGKDVHGNPVITHWSYLPHPPKGE